MLTNEKCNAKTFNLSVSDIIVKQWGDENDINTTFSYFINLFENQINKYIFKGNFDTANS